ncbi:LegC2/C7 family Dot/Icm T4SS effector [Legionella rowbothamii]|uniref:LegC2/C7 family Dot/Icm T4SS effector n=1 Tax=Legionella rowbothamii TaxID=96229 RepID=UPI001055DB20|nr:LegC2/C7 family Dot/Icm T4SS effector [Legionella rowbothamii]
MATTKHKLAKLVQADKGVQPSPPNAEYVLSQLQFSDAAKKIILDPNSFDQNTKGLESIAPSNELLIQVRNSLEAIIDSLEQNPSILTSITKYWGSLSLWEKIFGGLLVTGPTLVVGVAANVGFLITLSGLSAGAYITGGIVFEDHFENTKIITEKLKRGVFEIADVLVLTIRSLDIIRQKLTTEVEKFQEENKRLTSNINKLSDEVSDLSVQIESYMITEKHLRQTKEQLEHTAEELKIDLGRNQQKYDTAVNEISSLQKHHERCTQLLTLQVDELTVKRKQLEDELEKTRKLTSTLQVAVQTLSSTVINDAQQRDAFQERLEKFVKNKEQSFTQVADRICSAESELISVKKRLEESLKQHEELMEKQNQLIIRLEMIDQLVPAPPETRDDKININALCAHGFLGKNLQLSPKEAKPGLEQSANNI